MVSEWYCMFALLRVKGGGSGDFLKEDHPAERDAHTSLLSPHNPAPIPLPDLGDTLNTPVEVTWDSADN